MIKLVYVIRRRADLTPQAFRTRWLAHGPLVSEVAAAIRARRYIQSHTIDTPLNAVLADSRGMAEGYDGITEVWWDSMEELVAGMGSAESLDARRRLLDDEREFIDLARSFVFLTEEHPIFDHA
ncbi:MAG TPA: EthD domain-containing protein [Candidatus Limnocylindrales bacterium]|nr:EthD domain-containing protein [Candidatus Limnocylindrales bacterium]